MTAIGVTPAPPGLTQPASMWQRSMRALPAIFGGLTLAALLGSDDGIVLCPYRRCTGGDCPLCGTTRAAGRMLRGDLAASWQAHPLVILVAAQLPVWLAVSWWTSRSSRSNTGSDTPSHGWWGRYGTNVLLANVAGATVIWVVRLASGAVAGPATLTLPW